MPTASCIQGCQGVGSMTLTAPCCLEGMFGGLNVWHSCLLHGCLHQSGAVLMLLLQTAHRVDVQYCSRLLCSIAYQPAATPQLQSSAQALLLCAVAATPAAYTAECSCICPFNRPSAHPLQCLYIQCHSLVESQISLTGLKVH